MSGNRPRRVAFTGLALLVAIWIIGPAPLVFAGGASDVPSIENATVRLTFEPDHGDLAGFTDLANGYELVQPFSPAGATATRALWLIDWLGPESHASIAPHDARSFHWRRTSELTLVWDGFEAQGRPDLRVTATVSLDPGAPVASWRIAVEGADTRSVASVHFPRVTAIRPSEHETLAVPVWMGEKTDRPRDLLCNGTTPQRMEWDYPGILSMQCLALYASNGPGLYVECDDTAAFAKRFAVFGDVDHSVGLEIVQLPAARTGPPTRYESPYDVLLGPIKGDWFTAAERYRDWALRQAWAKQSRLRQGLTPDWVLQTGLWVWNRGKSGGVLDPAIALEKQSGVPVSVFWHWWHGCAYDVGFPEYLPPREGADAFRAAIARAHETGVHAIVYMNQRLWGMTTRSWTDERADRYAVKGPDGTVRPEVYNTFTKSPCASMCMGTAFWRNKYAGLAEAAVKDFGVDGIYMDQACSSLVCYDTTHGHPPGGGTYWMEGFHALQAHIRDRCKGVRPAALAGEGCGEAWLPYLDLMLSLQVSMERYAQPRQWEPIPLFHAVYHGCGVFYGNYSSLTMPPYDELWPVDCAPKEPLKLLDRAFSSQFRLEQARAFVWGQQPTIANFRPEHFEQRPEEMAYVLRLARLRNQALKYLLRGTMLPPPMLDVPNADIDLSRLSIYAGQQEALQQYRKACDQVLSSAWQAPDGDIAFVLANVASASVQFTLALDRARYPIREGATAFILDESERPAALSLPPGSAELPIALDPMDARIVRFEHR